MSFVKKYTDALPKYLEKARTSLERYFLIGNDFCKYSFESPQIYYAVFSADLGTHPMNLTKHYEYSGYYPTDLLAFPDDMKPILETNLSKRTLIAFNQCIRERYIQETHGEQIAESHYLIWQGMLTMFINNRTTCTVDEATEATVNHIRNATPLTDNL